MEKLVKYGEEFVFYISLKTAGSDAYQVNPTLAVGDVKVTQDGVGFGNIDTIPVVAPIGGTQVKVTVSVAELTGKQIQIQFIDAAGAEWKADTINIETYAHANSQHPYRGEGIYDRVITSANHNVTKSAAKFLRSTEEYQGYEGGLIYIDTVNGTPGSDPYTNGKIDKKVSNLADALSLGTALGMNDYHVSAGSFLQFISGQAGRSYVGHNWSLDLNNQAIDGVYLHGPSVTGAATAVTTSPKLEDCSLNGVTLPPGHYIACGFSSTVLAGASGDFFFTNCESDLAGGYPCFDFNASIGDVNALFREYRGELEFKNMGQLGTDLASVDGNGRVKMHATSIGGSISVQGHQELVNRATFIAAGGTVNDASRFAIDQLDGLALAGADGDTLKDISDQIDTIAQTGAYEVTLQYYTTGGTTPMPDVAVSLWNEGLSAFRERKNTDANGQVKFGMDAGTYKVIAVEAQSSFTIPETIIVTQTETKILYGDTFVVPLPGDPDLCNVYIDLVDLGLAKEEGVDFTANLVLPRAKTGVVILNTQPFTMTTDVTGRIIMPLAKGFKFTIASRALGKYNQKVEIDTTDKDTLVLADEI